MDSQNFLKICGLRPGYMNKEYMNISKTYLSNKLFLNNNFMKKFNINKENKIKKTVKENIRIKKWRDINNFVDAYMGVNLRLDNIDDYTTEYSSSEDEETFFEYISD